MEDNRLTVAAATTTTKVVSTLPTTARNGRKSPMEGEKAPTTKKKRSPFTLIKAAVFMVRRGPDGKSKPPVQTEVGSNDKLMKLVGSIRPLHLQDNQSPPPSTGELPEAKAFSSPDRPSSSSVDSMSQYGSAINLHALDEGYVSPYASSTNLQELDKEFDKESESSESRYASSTNLQKLDKRSERYASAKDLLELYLKGDSDDDDDDNGGKSDQEDLGNNGGDEMIDTKADEFITKFYNQMGLQHKQSFERY